MRYLDQVPHLCRWIGGNMTTQEKHAGTEQRLAVEYVILRRFHTKTWQAIKSYAEERGLERLTRENTSGIGHKELGLLWADRELFEQHGWVREKNRAYWRLDVGSEGSGDVSKGGSTIE